MIFERKICTDKDGNIFPGLFEIIPAFNHDKRGYFLEIYNKRDFHDAGLDFDFVQDNQSFSSKGVLRGLHFQKHHSQAKLIRVLSGTIHDVVVDLRNDSSTFGKSFSILLTDESQNMLCIPKGFAHGFEVLSCTACICYKCTDFYYPEDEGGILWNDPELKIQWKADSGNIPILSEKDLQYPCFNKSEKYFDILGNWIGV